MTVLHPESEEDPKERIFEVAVREQGTSGAVRWSVPASSPLEAVENVLTQTSTISDLSPRQQLRQLGQDLLEIAGVTEMPMHYFMSDERIARACQAMGMSVSQGWEWVSRL